MKGKLLFLLLAIFVKSNAVQIFREDPAPSWAGALSNAVQPIVDYQWQINMQLQAYARQCEIEAYYRQLELERQFQAEQRLQAMLEEQRVEQERERQRLERKLEQQRVEDALQYIQNLEEK